MLAFHFFLCNKSGFAQSNPVLHGDLRLQPVMLPPQWEHDQRGCQKVHPAVAVPVAAVLVVVATTGLTHSGKS